MAALRGGAEGSWSHGDGVGADMAQEIGIETDRQRDRERERKRETDLQERKIEKRRKKRGSKSDVTVPGSTRLRRRWWGCWAEPSARPQSPRPPLPLIPKHSGEVLPHSGRTPGTPG